MSEILKRVFEKELTEIDSNISELTEMIESEKDKSLILRYEKMLSDTMEYKKDFTRELENTFPEEFKK